MEGEAVPVDEDEDCPPQRYPVRAFAWGALTGPLIMTFGIMMFALISELSAAGIDDFADVLAAIWFVLGGMFLMLGISFPVGGFLAFFCLQTLMWLESRVPLARHLIMWVAMGTLFAMPVAWLFTPDLESDGVTRSPLYFLIVACGTVGGLFSWLAYYGRLPQIKSLNSSRTAR